MNSKNYVRRSALRGFARGMIGSALVATLTTASHALAEARSEYLSVACSGRDSLNISAELIKDSGSKRSHATINAPGVFSQLTFYLSIEIERGRRGSGNALCSAVLITTDSTGHQRVATLRSNAGSKCLQSSGNGNVELAASDQDAGSGEFRLRDACTISF